MTQPASGVDVRERGAPRGGEPQILERRLFMQLVAFEQRRGGASADIARHLARCFKKSGVGAVLYEDVVHPRGFALLGFSEEPGELVSTVRPALNDPELRQLRIRSELCMMGRSYSTGFEDDLEHWLLRRPRETALNPAWPWAIWYPLRRTGAFERLEPKDKGAILREHGAIGRSYGEADLAHDIRLACHGLDAHDNEFVIGLVGRELHPLSHVVQAMRRTRQTSEFIAQMGPFFVGRAIWRTPGA